MASLRDIVKEKIKLFDSAPDKMGTATERVQLKIWKELLPVINDLEVDKTGNIIQSDKNVSRIGIIADKLNEVLGGKEYQAVIKTFLNSIDEGVVLSNQVAQKFDPAFEPTAAQTKLLQLSKTNAIDTFIGSGLKNNVTQPFVEQLVTNISARAPLKDTINALQGVILGTDANEGFLLRHIKTTALTAQAVADRSYSAAINETIGAEYFEYLGGEIPTTRPFCQHREGEVFHVKEIEQWGRGINSGGINDIVDGTWAGRIEGTDAKSIFTFVGGWNCRHYLVPIEEEFVDDSVKARAKAEGFDINVTNNSTINDLANQSVKSAEKIYKGDVEGYERFVYKDFEGIQNTTKNIKSTSELKKEFGKYIATDKIFKRDNVSIPQDVKNYIRDLGKKNVDNLINKNDTKKILIEDINIAQQYVFEKPLLRALESNNSKVVLFKYNGKLYLNDGNHRVAAAKLNDKKTIDAIIVNVL